MDVADDGDLNVLFMKFNRKGQLLISLSNNHRAKHIFLYLSVEFRSICTKCLDNGPVH